MNFRIPEIVLGALLTVALFAMGFVVASSQYPSAPTQGASGPKSASESTKGKQQEGSWVTPENLLALFTLGLVIVGGVQVRFFYVQLRLIRESLNDAKIAANAAKEAADAGKIQAEIAQKTLVLTHRPKLIVRELVMTTNPTTRRDVAVSYVVANVGASPAEIIESWVDCQNIKDGIPRPLQPPEKANVIGPETIEAARYISRKHESTVSHQSLIVEHMGAQRKGPAGEPRLFFRGFIVYRDENLFPRRTSFCRAYDFGKRRFRVFEDPDYEYAD
jgi:hypothetical protein